MEHVTDLFWISTVFRIGYIWVQQDKGQSTLAFSLFATLTLIFNEHHVWHKSETDPTHPTALSDWLGVHRLKSVGERNTKILTTEPCVIVKRSILHMQSV